MLKIGVVFGVRVKSKYNGRFHGIILHIRRNSDDDDVELEWKQEVLNKPVSRGGVYPIGTKKKNFEGKPNYFDISIQTQQIQKQLACKP